MDPTTSPAADRADDAAIRPEVIAAQTRFDAELTDIADPRVMAYFHAGPLPDPVILRAYEDLVPGSAAKLFANYREQGTHRRAVEAKVVDAGIASQRLGMICGTSLAGMAIVGGCLVAILVGTTAAVMGGTTLAGTAAISLATAFVVGQTRQAKAGRDKADVTARMERGQAEPARPPTHRGEPSGAG